jgi:hypothetical protein
VCRNRDADALHSKRGSEAAQGRFRQRERFRHRKLQGYLVSSRKVSCEDRFGEEIVRKHNWTLLNSQKRFKKGMATFSRLPALQGLQTMRR